MRGADVITELKPLIRGLTYKGVTIRIEKRGKYSIVDMPNLVMMIRPRDAEGQVLPIAAKLRLAKCYIDEREKIMEGEFP